MEICTTPWKIIEFESLFNLYITPMTIFSSMKLKENWDVAKLAIELWIKKNLFLYDTKILKLQCFWSWKTRLQIYNPAKNRNILLQGNEPYVANILPILSDVWLLVWTTGALPCCLYKLYWHNCLNCRVCCMVQLDLSVA
jgi:hypothetical protein